MRNLVRVLVVTALIVGGFFAVRGIRTSFGMLEASRNPPVILHLANCGVSAVMVAAADSAPFAIPPGETRDVDNAFWGQGHVTRGRRYDYAVPAIADDMRKNGTATLFLQLDEQSRMHLAMGAGCGVTPLSPQPPGFPIEPLSR
jgi:hypothetical protein